MADESLDATILGALDSQFGKDRDGAGDADPLDDLDTPDDTETNDDDSDTGDVADDADADPASDKEDVADVEEEDTEAVETKDEKVEEDDADETDKELEALGIKRPKKGERENRLPYTRMKKIFGNAKKKWDAGVQATIKEHTDKHAKYEETLSSYRATDDLIVSDDRRFMQVLAKFHPTYQRYIDAVDKAGDTPAAQFAGTADDPRPQPDYEYPDGSKGYTPEGFEKVMQWNQRQAVSAALKEARKEWDKELGPIKKEREDNEKAGKALEARRGRAREQISRAQKVWGDELLGQHKDAILAKLAEDKTLAFDEAAGIVIKAKLTTLHGTVREQVVKDLNGRPAAAAKKDKVGTSKVAKNADDMTDEEAIMESLREQGLVK